MPLPANSAIEAIPLAFARMVRTLFSSVLDDFVVPIMYLRGARVLAAWGILGRNLVQGHLGPMLLLYLIKLIKIVLGIVVDAMTFETQTLLCHTARCIGGTGRRRMQRRGFEYRLAG